MVGSVASLQTSELGAEASVVKSVLTWYRYTKAATRQREVRKASSSGREPSRDNKCTVVRYVSVEQSRYCLSDPTCSYRALAGTSRIFVA